MNLAKVMDNDIADSDNGLCVSVWFNGCDVRCVGCHNKQLWSAVNEVDTDEVIAEVKEKLYSVPGITKSLSFLGGEPFMPENRLDLVKIVTKLKTENPELFVRIWTGRTFGQLITQSKTDAKIISALTFANEIIVGPYIESQRKILPLRGSSNQEILVNGKDYSIENGAIKILDWGKDAEVVDSGTSNETDA